MTRYWAGNKQVQAWGLKIFKTVILANLAFIVCWIAIESLIEFIKVLNGASILSPFCTADCSPFWMITLFILLNISIIGLLLAIWKAPTGFWLNFLLVLWGFFGVVYISDAWNFSWQPSAYYSAYPDNVPSYMDYITGNLLFWAWGVLGVAQLYLPKHIRKYVIWLHSSIVSIMLIGGILVNLYSYGFGK